MDDPPDHDRDAPAPSPSSPDVQRDATYTSPPTPPDTYIPRPPNAFILFRSAFIRSNRISGRVEGNHSTLSKIIGAVWRSISQQEREEWEAKARVALEEHKRRYPDWRFVNAQVRRGRGREGDGRGNGKRGRGRGKKRKVDGQRVEFIADLYINKVDSQTIERAVDEYDLSKQSQKVSCSLLHPYCFDPDSCQPIASTSALPDATVQPSAYAADSPYHLTSMHHTQPSPTSPYFIPNSSSSLINWAGNSSTQTSPTSATFPSPSYPAAYPEFINSEYTYYDNPPQPTAVTYEAPTYDTPYPYPTYSDAMPNSEPEYLLPVELAVPSPPDRQQDRLVWTTPWRSPPSPPPHRAANVDQYGWEIIPPDTPEGTPSDPHEQKNR